MKEQARARARQLAQEFAQRGDATGWFEELYTQAQGNEQAIHWADLEVNPSLVAWLGRRNIEGTGKLALVVGCGLGDDAEELARRGFEVVAFDIAPTAIAWCRQRFPQSSVEYVVADVFDPPSNWQGSFDFVLEAYTLQVLPAEVREPRDDTYREPARARRHAPRDLPRAFCCGSFRRAALAVDHGRARDVHERRAAAGPL